MSFNQQIYKIFWIYFLDCLEANIKLCCVFQCKTFNVVWSGRPGVLTLDWNVGFVLADTESAAVSWKYKFSQLKGSSDDNKCRLKLHFQLSESRIIETRVTFPSI